MVANYIVKTYMLFDFPPSSIMNYEMTVVYLMGILFTNLLKEKKISNVSEYTLCHAPAYNGPYQLKKFYNKAQ
jgi:hypothetical protein